MQAILIGLATAVILAIGAAFAAPFVVDWTAWRSSFEAEASRVLGVPVLIRGQIDADILPTPHIVLRNVALGADEVATGGTVRELRADLALGPLIRGEVEASRVTLVRPSLRLVLDSAGRLTAPTGTGRPAGFAIAQIAIAQIAIEQGTLDILDRGADRSLRLSDLNLKGEVRSTLGPFRLDGDGVAGGERYALRTSLGRLTEDGGRLRLIADGRTRPFSIDLDGQMRFAGGTPRFEGKGTLVRRGEAGAAADAWRLSAAVRASPEAIVADTLDLAMGEDTRPVQLSGSARLSLGRAVGLDAVLNARSLDLDALRPVPAGAAQAPADTLTGLLAGFAALPAPDVTSRIGIAVDQLTVGGTVIRDARADFTGTADGWRIDTGEAKLPGQTAIRLSGIAARGAAQPAFGGDLTLTSEDPATFLRWAAPRAAQDYAAAVRGPVRIAGRISADDARYAVSGLDAAFGPARLRGDGALSFTAGKPPQLDLRLAMEGADLDPLVGLARRAVGGGVPLTGRVSLDGQSLTLSGLPLRGLAVTAEATGQSWALSRFSLDDLVGLRITGTGQMDTAGAAPTGRLGLAIAGGKADGLVPLARLVAGPEAADAVQRLLPVAAPVQLSAAATWGEKGAHGLTAEGTLGQLSGRAAFARTDGTAPSRVDLALTAADGARALEAAGLPGLRQGLGPARIDLAIDPRADGTAGFDGRLSLGNAQASGQGSVRLAPDGALLPTLDMRLEGPDLARLLAAAGATDGAVPGSLTFALSRAGPLWRLERLAGTLAGAPVAGALDLEPGALPRLSGRLELDALSVPRLIGLWSARSAGPDVGTGPWSAARFAPAAPAPAAFALDLTAKKIELGGAYAVADGHMRILADSSAFEVRDLAGTLGSGHLGGGLTLRRRGEMLQADGRLSLDAVESGILLAPLAVRAPPRGRVTLVLDAMGTGRTPLAIVQALSGQGTLSVQELEIPGADPRALDSVMADTATGTPPDERRITAMYDRALARGPLRLDSLEGTFGIVNGVARLSPARAVVGNTSIMISGNLDLARQVLDITLEQEGRDAPGTMPGGAISWRGPLAVPERKVTSTALTGVISMRAIERETRRLEERQGLGGGAPALVPATPAPAPASAAPAAQPPAAASPAAPPVPAPAPLPQVVPQAAPQVAPQIAPQVAPQAPPQAAPQVPPQTPPAPQPAPQATPTPPAAPITAPAASAPAATPALPAAPMPLPAPPQPRAEPRQPDSRQASPRQVDTQAAPPLPPPVEISPTIRPRAARPDADPPLSIAPGVGGFGTFPRPPGLVPD
ncbi:AsmA-like C-terminal region-containing protein [Azorhizobium doebereinerae]|uniref:AsmA family protein n=1 Tax=Azorhizobium doebereinerae TaxID=281091 RepID=UPI0004192DED|nr:AsmA-like C-terminal region-containing protein [Azorhizobium doebereinerae]